MPHPAFLFDIGKVLLDFDFEKSLTTLLPADHANPHETLEKLLARKDDFEAGKISTSAYTEWAIAELSTPATPDEFHAAWRNIFTINEPMWETVRRLHAAGHRLILFSNTNAIHCPWIFEAYPEFALFHGSILSFEVDAIKPEPEIYRHAIETFSLIPEETLYIDDLSANIATGEQFHFHTHQYDLNKHAAFEQWLSEKLSSLKSSN